MGELENKYLMFEVDEQYLISLTHVTEIIEVLNITRVPETPDYIAGIVNLRGHVIPVLDVRKRFKKPDREGGRQCFIVAEINESPLALMVDNVLDLIDIEPENLKEPPQVGHSYIHVFVKYIGVAGNEMHLIVDPDKLVNYDDLFFLEANEGKTSENMEEELEE